MRCPDKYNRIALFAGRSIKGDRHGTPKGVRNFGTLANYKHLTPTRSEEFVSLQQLLDDLSINSHVLQRFTTDIFDDALFGNVFERAIG